MSGDSNLEMGVRGLQTFLKNNRIHLSTEVDLSNTSLVIDANNLSCFLFTSTCFDKDSEHFRLDSYGGNMVAFGEAVRKFFASLDKCDITPILVFDGSVIGNEELKDLMASKEATVHKRCLEKYNVAKTITEFDRADEHSSIFPCTLSLTFRSIIIELGIQRIQTPYEADTHIARIANDLDCPVLTNDSDFIIYPLKKGFIMLDLFPYKTPVTTKAGKNRISGFMFSQSRLTKFLKGLKSENMPLLSVLLGNDYVAAGTFDRVLESICNARYNGPLEANSFSHRRIANLLEWLKYRTLDQAIDYILSLVPAVNQPKLNRCIRIFLRNYRIESVDDFDTELERVYPKRETNPAELSPPIYLRRLFETTDLSSTCLDMIFHNTHYTMPSIDDPTMPTSNCIGFRPTTLCLALLRPKSYENLTTYRRQIQSEQDGFCVYDRLRGEYTKLIVRPLESLENFGSLDHLDIYSMILLEPAAKKNLLMACFRFNNEESSLLKDTLANLFEEPYLQEACLCFLLVKYIAQESNVVPRGEFVSALMMTLFYYAALKGKLNSEVPQEPYARLLLKLRPHVNFSNGKTYPNEPALFRRISHFISQLHSAYKAYGFLNALLDRAFHVQREDRFFNSILIYRVTKLLRTGEETMDGLCAGLQVLLDTCDAVKVQVHCN